MIPTNDNSYGRSYASLDECFTALALDACVVFCIRRLRGTGWRLTTRMVQS